MTLNEPELRPKLRPTHDQHIVQRDSRCGVSTSVEPVTPPRNPCWQYRSRPDAKARIGAWLVIAMQDRRDRLGGPIFPRDM